MKNVIKTLRRIYDAGEITSKIMFLREVNIAIYRPSIGALNTQ